MIIFNSPPKLDLELMGRSSISHLPGLVSGSKLSSGESRLQGQRGILPQQCGSEGGRSLRRAQGVVQDGSRLDTWTSLSELPQGAGTGSVIHPGKLLHT